MSGDFIKGKAAPLLILAVLAIVAYLPALTQPFISDDYSGIKHSLYYGAISGWKDLANDPVERPRATTFVLSYAVYHFFGMRPAAFYSANILLHILNCWLLFAAGRWRAIGYKLSFWGAAFFAVYEGHSEAIMWFSACNELLMVLFGLLSFVFWLSFLQGESAKLRWMWLALSFFCFIPSLLSKESSVIFVALFALPLLFPKPRLRQAIYLLPHALICVPYVISIFMTSSKSLRFHNQAFVLSAPFWITWPVSYGRMLWFWGLTGLISLFIWGRNERRVERIAKSGHGDTQTQKGKSVETEGRRDGEVFSPSLSFSTFLWLRVSVAKFFNPQSAIRNPQSAILVSVLWMGIGFIPYMFVDYMHRIPSRQTYLASAGLGWLMGAAIIAMRERYAKNHKWGRPVVLVVLLVILTHNVAYLWTKKHWQYLERAEPTERLLELARSVNGPIYVKCFPSNLGQSHAESALALILNKPADTLIWNEEEARKRPPAATFCYE